MPYSSPQYWYLSDSSADDTGPQMDTPEGMRPYSSGKMRPSDSTVRIGLDMSQNDRLGLLGNGLEGFP